jgi:hypothetical protein
MLTRLGGGARAGDDRWLRERIRRGCCQGGRLQVDEQIGTPDQSPSARYATRRCAALLRSAMHHLLISPDDPRIYAAARTRRCPRCQLGSRFADFAQPVWCPCRGSTAEHRMALRAWSGLSPFLKLEIVELTTRLLVVIPRPSLHNGRRTCDPRVTGRAAERSDTLSPQVGHHCAETLPPKGHAYMRVVRAGGRAPTVDIARVDTADRHR